MIPRLRNALKRLFPSQPRSCAFLLLVFALTALICIAAFPIVTGYVAKGTLMDTDEYFSSQQGVKDAGADQPNARYVKHWLKMNPGKRYPYPH